MLRFFVFSEDFDYARDVHKSVIEVIKGFGLRCEIVFSDKIEQIIKPDSKLYDIWLIDTRSVTAAKLAASVRCRSLIPSIILMGSTGVHEYMLKYRPSAFVKDAQDPEKLEKVLRWCCNEQIKAHPYFSVKNKDMQMKIEYENISYFESRQRIAVLHTSKQVIEFYAKLSEVYALLPESDFVRCHQSYIVNMSRIKELDKVNRCFRLLSGVTIDISKSHYPAVVMKYEKYLSEH